ncbi:MAG: hypothetical protein ACL7BU_14920 [Candidatus Phlomobacter fragariae]
MIKFFLNSAVPCGFVDNEGKVATNVKMKDLLYLLIHLPEMGTLLEKIHSEKAPKVWQFHFFTTFLSR